MDRLTTFPNLSLIFVHVPSPNSPPFADNSYISSPSSPSVIGMGDKPDHHPPLFVTNGTDLIRGQYAYCGQTPPYGSSS